MPAIAHAELLSAWTQQTPQTGRISSDLGTASPVLGNGSAGSASNQSIYAASSTSYTLALVGDSISLSGSATFAGLTSTRSDEFRFGLHDVNESSTGSGWLGYWASSSGTTSSLWELNPNNILFVSDSDGSGRTGAAKIASVTGVKAFNSGVYTYSIAAERTASGLALSWSITGPDVDHAVSGSFTDTSPQTYTFDRVGFLVGGALMASQVTFSDVNLTYAPVSIPEPSVFAVLAGVGALGFAGLRRRRRCA